MANRPQIRPAWVRRIREGDLSAETELVEYYSASLRHILRIRYKDPELVKDVLQDTFLAVIQNLRDGRLENADALTAYIRQTALNQANTFLRKENRSTTTDPTIVETLASTSDLLSKIEEDELAELVRDAIDSLSQSRDRELILQFYYYDTDKRFLCEKFDVSPAHFDRVNFRARQRLRELVEKRTKKHPPLLSVALIMLLALFGRRTDG